jgi:hypothetical protein
MQNRGLNELLCAAMINRNFCEILITDPSLALSEGYEGHVFNLAPEEYNLVTHIQAINLEDFAEQVYDWIQVNRRRQWSLSVIDEVPAEYSVRSTGVQPQSRVAHLPMFESVHSDDEYYLAQSQVEVTFLQ